MCKKKLFIIFWEFIFKSYSHYFVPFFRESAQKEQTDIK